MSRSLICQPKESYLLDQEIMQICLILRYFQKQIFFVKQKVAPLRALPFNTQDVLSALMLNMMKVLWFKI